MYSILWQERKAMIAGNDQDNDDSVITAHVCTILLLSQLHSAFLSSPFCSFFFLLGDFCYGFTSFAKGIWQNFIENPASYQLNIWITRIGLNMHDTHFRIILEPRENCENMLCGFQVPLNNTFGYSTALRSMTQVK